MDRIAKALHRAKQKSTSDFDMADEPDDIEYHDTRCVAVTERKMHQERIIEALDDKLIIDSYKLLRTRVLRAMQQNGWQTLGVTSAGAKVGKSLTSINLAISIAHKTNMTAMVVDCDFRRPSLNERFGFEVQAGLSDYLQGTAEIKDIMVNPGIERLTLLPTKQTNGQFSEMLVAPKMLRLIEELKSRYKSRVVIFDLPPVLVGDDVVAIAPHLDALMFVVEEGKSQSTDVRRSIQLLEDYNVIGTVLNQSSEKSHDTDYYH